MTPPPKSVPQNAVGPAFGGPPPVAGVRTAVGVSERAQLPIVIPGLDAALTESRALREKLVQRIAGLLAAILAVNVAMITQPAHPSHSAFYVPGLTEAINAGLNLINAGDANSRRAQAVAVIAIFQSQINTAKTDLASVERFIQDTLQGYEEVRK